MEDNNRYTVTMTGAQWRWVEAQVKRVVKEVSDTNGYPKVIEAFCAIGRSVLAAIEKGREDQP